MKKLLAIILLYCNWMAIGQTLVAQNNQKSFAKNTAYAEVGGVCGWGGIHFERQLYATNNLKWKTNADVGYAQYTMQGAFIRNQAYQLGISYGTGYNNIYYDFSIVYFRNYYSYQGTRSFIEDHHWYILPKIGIRYQKPSNGIFLNASVFYIPNTDPISSFSYDIGNRYDSPLDQPYIPRFWFGVGIGYTFKCL